MLSSKSTAYPTESSLFNQNLNDLLMSRYPPIGPQVPSSPPPLDQKVLVQLEANTKRLRKISGSNLYIEDKNCFTFADFDRKHFSIIGNIDQLNNRYKTELCRPFTIDGYCKYASKCQYAHGAHELRPLFRHLKHKTRLCDKYHNTGFCNYGSRCTYIHRLDGADTSSIQGESLSEFSGISPPTTLIANNAFSFPPLLTLPSLSPPSSDNDVYESCNSSPLSLEGNFFA